MILPGVGGAKGDSFFPGAAIGEVGHEERFTGEDAFTNGFEDAAETTARGGPVAHFGFELDV